MKEYYIHPLFARKPKLLVNIDGVRLNLLGKNLKEKIPATKTEPEREIEIKGADQKDLENLFENAEKYGDFSRIIKARDIVKGKRVANTDS